MGSGWSSLFSAEKCWAAVFEVIWCSTLLPFLGWFYTRCCWVNSREFCITRAFHEILPVSGWSLNSSRSHTLKTISVLALISGVFCGTQIILVLHLFPYRILNSFSGNWGRNRRFKIAISASFTLSNPELVLTVVHYCVLLLLCQTLQNWVDWAQIGGN